MLLLSHANLRYPQERVDISTLVGPYWRVRPSSSAKVWLEIFFWEPLTRRLFLCPHSLSTGLNRTLPELARMATKEEEKEVEATVEKAPEAATEKAAEEKQEVKTADVKDDTPAPGASSNKPSLSNDEILSAVKERLQFFFSDANLRQDSFMRKQLMGEKKALTIEDLLRFNTIKQYTSDAAVLKKAAQQLPDTLKVVDDKAIARLNEFTKDLMDKNIPVTLLVGNLPFKKESDGRSKYEVTVENVKELFSGYGPLALVKFRFGYMSNPDADILRIPPFRNSRPKGQRLPLGSALVEFETADGMTKAVADTLTISDGTAVESKRPLSVESFGPFSVVKLEEYLQGISKKRKAEPEQDDKGDPENEEEEEELPTFRIDWKPGCVIKLEGLSETCDREQMLEAIAKGLDKDVDAVKEMKVYVDYSRGQTDGCIRFLEPDQVSLIFDKLKSGELEIAGTKVAKVELLEGDVEKQYWQDFMDFKTKQMRLRREEKKNRANRKKFRHN